VTDKGEKRLTQAEVELVLRRAAEFAARRRSRSAGEPSVSPEILIQVAAAAGIPEEDVRRAVDDLDSTEAKEPESLAKTLYGPARLRVSRELDRTVARTREELEKLLRIDQGLKLRRKTGAVTVWDPGDMLGMVRRTLDFSGHRVLLRARSVELRVADIGGGRSEAGLTADTANQRGEYLSMGWILGATLSLLALLAGIESSIFLLAIIPALAAPVFGFRLAYARSCTEIRRSLDDLLDGAEEDPEAEPARRERPPGHIQGLKPIPRFTSQKEDE
jgi:hypothetical protein